MSDRRRRRVNDEGEDESADTGTKPRGERPSECESEEESGDAGDLSESESTADDGTEKEDDETEEGTDTETEGSYTEEATDSETETEEGDDYTDEDDGLDGERQSGDGQEQPEDDKPDDDEDRKNPAYVPRKGAFYEHDSREGFEDDAEEDKGEVTEQKKTKKLWQEESKWGHDCYREDLQAPKSREELIGLYGYDILDADEAPEAPPMVKRGRGRGRKRDTRFNDYLPRMAVIDTTEYGADTVPTLDEDGLITYRDSKPVRSSRGRGSHVGRGANPGSKFRGRDSTDNYQGDDREDKYHSRQEQRDATPVQDSQDARNADFPSLNEMRGGRSNRDYNKDRTREQHPPQQYGNNQSNRESMDSPNSYNYDRNNRRSGGSGRFSNSYDDDGNSPNHNRRGGDRNSGGNYRGRGDARNYISANGGGRGYGGDGGSGSNYQNYGGDSGGANFGNRNERRENYSGSGGGNNNSSNYNRQMESNWRRSDHSGSDNNRRVYQEQRGSRGRGRGDGGGGRSRPYDGGDDFSDRVGGHQKKMAPQDDHLPVTRRTIRTGPDNTLPRHHQQQQQQHIDSREYTGSKAGIGSGGGSNSGSGVVDNRTVPSSRPAQGSGLPGENNNSNNVVISNKENVQTINVTITSTTTEKKSYAKERRAKGAGAGAPSTIPKAGDMQQGSQAMVRSGLADGKSELQGKFPPPPVPGVPSSVAMAPGGGGAKRYSSQRQQQQQTGTPKPSGYSAKADKTAPGLPVDQGASTLYNPAMPPPSFFQHDSTSSSGNGAPPPQGPPPPSAGGPQDPQQRFNPSILPPGNPALSFGLPVPTPGLPIPAPTGSPNMFQGPPASIGGPPAATGPPLMGPPFIAPGMMYGTSPTPNPRVPPPATPVGFPIPLAAYPAGPPPPPTQPPSNVGPPPVSQGATNPVPGGQQLTTKPKKVYRGDITYYAPELQQPARTTQKRPKSAIPIVDPQEISQIRAMEKLQQQREQTEKSAVSLQSLPTSTPLQSPPEASAANTAGVGHSSDSRLAPKVEHIAPLSTSDTTTKHPKEEVVLERVSPSETVSRSEPAVNINSSEGGGDAHHDSLNNSISDSTSHGQDKTPLSDMKKESLNLNSPKVVSSPTTDLPLNKDQEFSSVENSPGEVGRFIKGKLSADSVVMDSSSSNSGSSVKQELSSPVVNSKDGNSSCVDEGQSKSSSETVFVKEEIVTQSTMRAKWRKKRMRRLKRKRRKMRARSK